MSIRRGSRPIRMNVRPPSQALRVRKVRRSHARAIPGALALPGGGRPRYGAGVAVAGAAVAVGAGARSVYRRRTARRARPRRDTKGRFR
jgi:NAD(P)H-hydrate repair Nnr-like enzyme with NAD(P)H-hydrate dehydratase domain